MKNIKSSELTEIVNSILRKHNIPLNLRAYDLNFWSAPGVVKWSRTDLKSLLPEDKISTYLKTTVFKQVDITNTIFYHYLPKRAYLDEIKKTECIRLYNLNKYLTGSGDKLEYRHFLEMFGIDFPKFEEQITNIKDDIFIWCLTNIINSTQHWNKFADGGKGVAIAIQFKVMESYPNSFKIADVCYRLEFLEEIQSFLNEKYGRRLEISGYPSFAHYFKQKSLEWENETRLSFNNNFWQLDKAMQDIFKYKHPQRDDIDNLFSVQVDTDNDEKYILIPLKNTFFELEIIEVYDKSNTLN